MLWGGTGVIVAYYFEPDEQATNHELDGRRGKWLHKSGVNQTQIASGSAVPV